jgi:hypothetical protein
MANKTKNELSPLFINLQKKEKIYFPFPEPLGQNSVNSLSVLFQDREYYYRFVLPYLNETLANKIPFANLIERNSLFGLIDQDLNVVLPIESFMKELPSADEQKKLAMDFVVDAFTEMKAYLQTAASLGKLSKKSVFYNLKAHKAQVNARVSINATQLNLIDKFIGYVNNNTKISSEINDAKSFNKKFLNFLYTQAKNRVSVTKSNIALSSNFSVFVSGLVIDIANDKADNDTIKFNKYFLDSDFICFSDACNRFGFKIDANVPWRIIADLNSPAMKGVTGNHNGYMRRYGINSVDDLFNQRYVQTAHSELDYMKNFFYNAYTALVALSPFYEPDYKKLDICDFNKIITKKRIPLTIEEYEKFFSDKHWLRTCAYLRNYEDNRGFSQQEFENVVREANNFLAAGSTYRALDFLNKYFKQFKNVYYFSSLQQIGKVVEQNTQSMIVPEIVF